MTTAATHGPNYIGLVVLGLLLAGVLSAFVITLLKGKITLGLLAWIGGLGLFVWPVTAWRLAKPNSWWARNRYDDEQRALAAARFESKTASV